jgi:hypothetical protein
MKSKIQDSRSKRGVFYYLIIGILFGSGILCLGSLVGGCGSDTQTATTTTTTTASTTTTATATTTTTVVGSITLSGTLNSGSISSAGVKVWAAVSDYSVVAIDNISGKSYHASTDATGAFSLSLPSTASYEISLVNSDAKYFGPMVMVGGAVSTEVVMGVRPVSDASLGDIVVDASKGMAKPATEPLALASFWDTAEATAGTPKGTLYCGKERLSGIITREGSADMDRDGIPDIFDADEDDDGIRKGIISTFRPPAASETVEAVFIAATSGRCMEIPKRPRIKSPCG